MPQTMQCPDCRAHLELPSLTVEQTVQCPRCQHVFTVVQPRPIVQSATPKRTLDDEQTSNEAMPLPPPRALRGEWLGKAAMVLISLSLLSYTAQLYLHQEHMQIEKALLGRDAGLFRPGLGANVLPAEIFELEQRRERAEQWEEFANPAHRCLFWLATLAFLGWAFCASTNAWNLHAAGMYFIPTTAVLSFFIPILNFFWPYAVFQEIWRASHPRAIEPADAWKHTAGLRLIVAWWICVIAGMCLWIFRKPIGLDAELAGEPDIVELFASLSHLIAIVEGVLLILIIRAIMQRQEERHLRLAELALDERA